MRQPRLWIEIVITVIIAVAAFFAGRASVAGLIPANGPGSTAGNGGTEGVAAQSATREEVPAGTVVPDLEGEVAANVAMPKAVIPAAPGVDSKKRIFEVTIEGGKFVPDTIVVNAGDIASVTFASADGSYEIVQPDYGFKMNISEGEKRLLEGQFSHPGKYLFYCNSCGGPAAGPRGYFIVVP